MFIAYVEKGHKKLALPVAAVLRGQGLEILNNSQAALFSFFFLAAKVIL